MSFRPGFMSSMDPCPAIIEIFFLDFSKKVAYGKTLGGEQGKTLVS